ncbi:MAG: HD domain-containing protein [Breznakibacter sp.]
MGIKTLNKKKIVNDPVHGFISIPSEFVYDLMETDWFQRLRRIKQLGLTYLVYPGATHTRFQHALGAMFLMENAVSVLRSKGHAISIQEEEAALAAILLHDIGHGPFSHVLENTLVENVSHEVLSKLIIKGLNHQMHGALGMALDIFTDQYPKKFLHQLVSGQLDMDRLDYLKRDSFFTGVSEGVISSDRIIKMLDVSNDKLVVEVKGIYSIEKFLIARRLMYWQVYLHKTVLVAESQLVKILKRARKLSQNGVNLNASPALAFFLNEKPTEADFYIDSPALTHFLMLDDDDVTGAIKGWTSHPDPILSRLSADLMARKLCRIEMANEPFAAERVKNILDKVVRAYHLGNPQDAEDFVYTGTISNNAYSINDEKINILYNNNQIKDISEASDVLNLSVLGKKVTKHYLCYPKWVEHPF